MMAEWILIGLLVLLVLAFVVDVAGRRASVPRPKPVPQRKPEALPGPRPEPLDRESVSPGVAPAGEQEVPVSEETVVSPAEEPQPVKEPEPEPEPEPEKKVSVFQRIKAGLGKTRQGLGSSLSGLFSVGRRVDEDLLEEIETTLLMADVGVTATTEIIDSLTEKLNRSQLKDGAALKTALKDELRALLAGSREPLAIDTGKKPWVMLMVGVNGVGKTTTIGKLAHQFRNEGRSVMLAAGDTFRAAAVEQLQVWGDRNDVPVIAQHTGADSASVIFDAVQSAQARGTDVVIADTAGRLQNKDNLMSELEKVVRVMKKLDESAPHEVMLVLDAGTGQNALSQAQVFQQAVGVSGIALTKLDGTAKGGIVFAIARQLGLPIRYIGVGEQVEDLRPFEPETFVDALFDD
ncbi:signal recognition particle-docking protein FtsY [Marinobacter lacisalsi]|uniref:Signal recognition particle receptor FtsY n=1 Tax=Marinobacter lacisalsi TaxID=475979 RepID=A0ABV8QDK2_9GAMM